MIHAQPTTEYYSETRSLGWVQVGSPWNYTSGDEAIFAIHQNSAQTETCSLLEVSAFPCFHWPLLNIRLRASFFSWSIFLYIFSLISSSLSQLVQAPRDHSHDPLPLSNYRRPPQHSHRSAGRYVSKCSKRRTERVGAEPSICRLLHRA